MGMDQDGMRKWYVVATKPQSEATASRSIARLGFSVYAPTIMVMPKHGIVPVLKPMFPHYLFVPFDAERDHWTRIACAWGVSRILTTGAPDFRPLAMPAGEIETLMNMLPSDVPAEIDQPIQEGDEIDVIDGARKGLWGRVLELDSRGRCVLMLRILGGEFKARAKVAQIARRRSD
jgi:transcription antitermination factor NusG